MIKIEKKFNRSRKSCKSKVVILKHTRRIICNLASCTFKISEKLIEFESIALIEASTSSLSGLNCIKISQIHGRKTCKNAKSSNNFKLKKR
jgi:hypothetical protein